MPEKQQHDWLQIAKKRFPLAAGFAGNGEFCATCCGDKVIRLFEDVFEMWTYITKHHGCRPFYLRDLLTQKQSQKPAQLPARYFGRNLAESYEREPR